MEQLNSDDLSIKTPYGTIMDLTIHLINTINHWLDFFDDYFKFPRGEEDFDYNDFIDVLKLWEQTDKRLEDVIEAFDENEFEDYFTYSHDKVEQYKIKFCDLFLHLTCHSYYHRGQLALIFRQHDLAPLPPIDADDYFKILIQ
jgi:uncharacterized damage-inducible protein DinB